MAEFFDDVGRRLQLNASLNVPEILAARSFGRFGLRRILVFGGALPPIEAIPAVLLSPITPPMVADLGSLTTGFGMGLPSTAAIVLMQASVGWTESHAVIVLNPYYPQPEHSWSRSAGQRAQREPSTRQFEVIATDIGVPDGQAAIVAAAASRAGLAHRLHLTF
ncbi:MAG: hypothetical protein ABW128_04445 [Rhizorhabdus sp.]